MASQGSKFFTEPKSRICDVGCILIIFVRTLAIWELICWMIEFYVSHELEVVDFFFKSYPWSRGLISSFIIVLINNSILSCFDVFRVNFHRKIMNFACISLFLATCYQFTSFDVLTVDFFFVNACFHFDLALILNLIDFLNSKVFFRWAMVISRSLLAMNYWLIHFGTPNTHFD